MAIVVRKMHTTVDLIPNSPNQPLAPLDNTFSLVSQKLLASYSFEGTKLKVGQRIRMEHTGKYSCTSCEKYVKKLFNGVCFTCLSGKASSDVCIVSPYKCHFHLGTCREPEWGKEFCFQPHCVYLAYTDKHKVGITRLSQVPFRWIDQGATSALVIAIVPNRYIAGVIEKNLSQFLPDKTHWMKMLLNVQQPPNFEVWKELLNVVEHQYLPGMFEHFASVFPNISKPEFLSFFSFSHAHQEIVFPLEKFNPAWKKLTSCSFDKTPTIEGELLGVKGQYLYFEHGVINMRRHEGYEINLWVENP